MKGLHDLLQSMDRVSEEKRKKKTAHAIHQVIHRWPQMGLRMVRPNHELRVFACSALLFGLYDGRRVMNDKNEKSVSAYYVLYNASFTCAGTTLSIVLCLMLRSHHLWPLPHPRMDPLLSTNVMVLKLLRQSQPIVWWSPLLPRLQSMYLHVEKSTPDRLAILLLFHSLSLLSKWLHLSFNANIYCEFATHPASLSPPPPNLSIGCNI